jgi:phage shock protein C
MIGGVAAGLADYFAVDPSLVRILWVLAFFLGGAGLLLYIILWVILPEENRWSGERASPTDDIRQRNMGLLLLGIGVIFLARNIFPAHLFWIGTWPVLLIALGIYLIIANQGKIKK